MRREQHIFRGCLLLLPIVFPILFALLFLISGRFSNDLNRIGIIFDMVGILSVVPDIIGEKRLGKIVSNIQGYKKTRQYIKMYLYSSQETPNQHPLPFHVFLDLAGNFIMSILLVCILIGLILYNFQSEWVGILLLLTFGCLGIESITWIILLMLFLVFRPLVYKMPNLFTYFAMTNSLISVLGIFISSALAYTISVIISLLIWIAKIPLRKLIATVTLPFIFLGSLLQFLATFF